MGSQNSRSWGARVRAPCGGGLCAFLEMDLIYPGHVPGGQLRLMPETTGRPLVVQQAWHLRGIFRDDINRHSGHNLCSLPYRTNCRTNCSTMTVRAATAAGWLACANRDPAAPHTAPAVHSRRSRQQDAATPAGPHPASKTVCTSDIHFCGPGSELLQGHAG